MICGEDGIYRARSSYLGTLFITVKTPYKNLGPCTVMDLNKIALAHREGLAGWGEVPYSIATKLAQQNSRRIQAAKNTQEQHPRPAAMPNINATARLIPNNTEFTKSIKRLHRRDETSPEEPGVIARMEYLPERNVISSPNPNVPGPKVGTETESTFFLRPRFQGQGVKFYLVDTGFDTMHSDRCLSDDDDEDFDFEEYDYHGTAMMGRIVGSRFGLAPLVDPFIVQFVNRYGYYTSAHLFDAMLIVYDHMEMNDVLNAVVLAAWMYDEIDADLEETALHKPQDLPEGKHFANVFFPRSSFYGPRKLVRWLSSSLSAHFHEQGRSTIVASGGNVKIHPTEFLAPARDQAMFYPAIVVASDVTLGAQKRNDDLSRGMKVPFWALGEHIHTIGYDEIDGSSIMKTVYGPSYAAADVAGLLAALLSEDLSVTKLKPNSEGYNDIITSTVKRMVSLTYPRVEGGPPVIYNGIRRSEWPTKKH
ncbi:hypothetical protein TWF696_006841 [Orbilia brochopaga]|uniref:Peptidase S8/S53 domain-containing protein n=1 Tax=Orbilia brochopaga TaxID=3140254 RepID=A0AAV9UQT8_9PEZI